MIKNIDRGIFNNPLKYDVGFNEIMFSAEDIRRSLGYKLDDAPLPVSQIIDDIFPELEKLVDLKAGYLFLYPDKISFGKESFFYDSLEFECKSIIGKRLRKSDTAALFLVSIGNKLEELSRELMNGDDILKGYILDNIGSVLAEKAADWLEVKIESKVNKYNWKITNRYSPGFCGWYVMEQKKLFSLFPENFCGVTLTDSALMLPIKSVSGVIGVGENVEKEEYECSLCDVEFCYKRLD